MNPVHAPEHPAPQPAEGRQPAKDPVCGMTVDPRTAAHEAVHAGERYVFCSGHCQAKFEQDPAGYLSGASSRPQQAPADAVYICPMHPEVRQVGPGDCPICGMALEPEMVTVESGRAPNTWTCAGASGSAPLSHCRS